MQVVVLSAKGSSNPDDDDLTYQWWQYHDAGTYDGTIEMRDAENQDASFTVPEDASRGIRSMSSAR